MKYGYFSEDKQEFIIQHPDTLKPWINYLRNRNVHYVSLLSANAGGYSFIDCPKDGRITRWRYNSLPQDRPGRYLYLKSLDVQGGARLRSWGKGYLRRFGDFAEYLTRMGRFYRYS